jgi:hypothetical protein
MNSVAHGEFRKWALTACADWGYPEPAEDYFLQTFARLPDGLMRVLGHGLETGLVIPQGRTFTLKKLDANKGPYNAPVSKLGILRSGCGIRPALRAL